MDNPSERRTDPSLVWYASYGSNLDRDRFLAYLTGASLPESDRPHTGARDPSEPVDDRSFTLPHQLFFAGSSQRWDGGGVAFIDRAVRGSSTNARTYLITAEQFEDVFAQENRQEHVSLDLETLSRTGSLLAGGQSYGLVLKGGDIGGRPVLTFTSPLGLEHRSTTKPAASYLRRLSTGLRSSHGLRDEEIAEYLLACPGIEGAWTQDELKRHVLER